MLTSPTKQLAWGYTPGEFLNLCEELNEPKFRSKQIWEWLYKRRIETFDAMTNIPASLRSKLAQKLDLTPWLSESFIESPDGVRKLLLECRDGEKIESVIIPSRDAATLCVSTQAGCAFGCAFCATGTCGLVRNLDVGEIVGQFMAAQKVAPRRLTHIVFMGMGEPFANYDAVLKSVRIFNDFDGIAIGSRRMTISTCGVVPGINKLSQEGMQVELAISLHAPNNAIRSQIMPINKRYPLEELLAAAKSYTEKTGRIITFEYTLVQGLNTSDECAKELLSLVRSVRGRVNLIPLSPVKHFPGNAPTPEESSHFASILTKGGINVTLRHSKGKDATAACGQLRLQHQ